MLRITNSIKQWLRYLKGYYQGLLSEKSVRRMAVCIAFTCILTSIVVTWADVAGWVMDDIIDKDIIFGRYDFVRSSDAPAPSDNEFHLNMPMALEDYLDPSIYESLNDGLRMAVKPDFVDPGAIELWSDEESEQASNDASEFITSRPPKVMGR